MAAGESDKANLLRQRGLHKLHGFGKSEEQMRITHSLDGVVRVLTDEQEAIVHLVCFMLGIVRHMHPDEKNTFVRIGAPAWITLALDDSGQYWIGGVVNLTPDGFVESTQLQPLDDF